MLSLIRMQIGIQNIYRKRIDETNREHEIAKREKVGLSVCFLINGSFYWIY